MGLKGIFRVFMELRGILKDFNWIFRDFKGLKGILMNLKDFKGF